MSKITLNNVANLENETTAVNVINTNSATITTAFDNTLSRDGSQPNTMGSDLDMNSNRVLNLPSPASNFEPIRFIDAASLGQGGSITLNPLPSGGSAGQALTKNSSTNFDTSWSTLGTVPSGGTTNQALLKNSGSNFDTKWGNAVTSVGLAAPADFTVTNSPVTTTGNLTISLTNTPTGTGGFVRQNSPTINTPQISAITNAGSTMNVPVANDTFVGKNTVDILTNKTIGTTQLSGTIPATNMPSYAGDVTTASGSLTTSISANAVTNSQQAPMAAFTLKGNATGSTANPTDISIPALTQKASPVSGDMIMIADSAASNALKFATVSSIATAGSVSSLGGLTGAVTLGSGITTSGNSILSDPAMIGEIRQLAFNRVPTNFLSCDGSTILRSSFASLFAALVVSSVVTITVASPAVITWTGNPLSNNDPVLLTTTGALPTGLSTATKYYVRNISGNTFNLATTPGGSAINTSGTQSGTHTAINAPWEGTAIGNGSTTFTLPALNGYFIRGADPGNAKDSNHSFGTPQTDQMQGHIHSANVLIQGFLGGSVVTTAAMEGSNNTGQNSYSINTSGANSDGTNGTPRTGAETRPINQTLKYVIRYQ